MGGQDNVANLQKVYIAVANKDKTNAAAADNAVLNEILHAWKA